MTPIAAARSGNNIRRTCSLANDITSSAATAAAAASRAVTNSSGKNAQAATQSHPKNSKLYKTELCRTWMDCGRCNYGEKCQYAHGEQERRPVSRHPKYKTEYCQPFHQVGYCPYGPRCNFIHNEDQAPHLLQIRRNQNNCNCNAKVKNGRVANGTATLAVTTAETTTCTTTTLTFGVWQPFCGGSTGESPAPSSTGSSNDSPADSTSPIFDFDELSTAAAIVANSKWNNTFGNQYNNNLCHFNWPSTVPTTSAVITAAATPLINQPTIDPALINDLLELTVDEKNKKATLTNSANESAVKSNAAVTSGRLPVFAQLSNPSTVV